MTQRTERIDQLLRQEIGRALEREVTDPGIGFVTVTDVETSPDLAHARVWVSVIGTEERRKASLAGLRRAMPYIRRGLASKIRLRRIPELEVRLDSSIERGTRVLQIIHDLEEGRTPDGLSQPSESLPTPLPRLPHEGDTVDDPLVEEPSGHLARKAEATGSRKRESHIAPAKGTRSGKPAARRRPR